MTSQPRPSNVGAVRGTSVLLNSWEGIQTGAAYRWRAFCGARSREGTAHTEQAARAIANEELSALVAAERRDNLRGL